MANLLYRLGGVPGKMTRYTVEVLEQFGPGATIPERLVVAQEVLGAPSRGNIGLWADTSRLYGLLADWGVDVDAGP